MRWAFASRVRLSESSVSVARSSPEASVRRFKDEVQKVTDQYVRKSDELVKTKEAEILEV